MGVLLSHAAVLRCAVALGLSATAMCAFAGRPAAPRYATTIAPLLAKRCLACHGPDRAESGLRLSDRESMLAESDSGARPIVAGEAAASELVRRVESADESERMPPEGPALTPKEIESLRSWIDAGAPFERHWAFARRATVVPPDVNNDAWVTNPIDHFVLAKLEEARLAPAQAADRPTIARRLYYDLIGLPPTPTQLAAFVTDDSEGAYSRLVDELLASPHYGEKWARHWLDVVRYAETNSFERDAAKPFAWKYRDYVIRSFNEDKPFDRFVVEQLAGDEVSPVTEASITATGYYRLGTWDDEPADPLQARYDDLDSIVSTTGQAFLGLTVGCARCHDHKIDPFPQTNYYQLLSFFADVTPYADTVGRDAKLYSLWDLSPAEAKAERTALRGAVAALEAGKLAMEEVAIKRMDGVDQRRSEQPENRPALLAEKLAGVQSEGERLAYAALVDQRAAAQGRLDAMPEAAMALSLAVCEPRPEPIQVMARGNPHVPGDAVEPAFPDLFGNPAPAIPDPAPDARSAGRRIVLANWIASPDNLLTARVIANRVWQHHFGRGIVRSANNFGQLGTPPTHPELLDWLAGYLVEHGWRLKELHRLIVHSSAYRMSSRPSAAALAADPANDLFSRFDLRRLTAEEVRDSALAVTGALNADLYGPSVFPKLSAEVHGTQSRPGEGWPTSDEKSSSRRSIYIHIKRSLVPPELSAFDFPETDTSCEARFNTTQPGQALNLLHGEFLRARAGDLAERVANDAGAGVGERIAEALRIALQRDPDAQTVSDVEGLYKRLVEQHGVAPDEALRQCCLVVLNLNEFVYID
ncbi:MAG: PSD1 and planctomycete cytochrome C domain-containing protein [Lacipirellulaceae bacterium]